MLVINAGNLMKGVIGALKSAEAASVRVSDLICTNKKANIIVSSHMQL